MPTSKKFQIDLSSPEGIKNSIKDIEKLKRYYKNKDMPMRRIKQKIETTDLRYLLNELREYPPPRDTSEKIQFVSAKQRKYVMRLLKGKGYKRTGQLAKGWNFVIVKTGTAIKIKITQTTPYAQYVIGKFGMGKSRRSIGRYTKTQQPFHVKTGWRPAYKSYQLVQEKIAELKEQTLVYFRKWILDGFK